MEYCLSVCLLSVAAAHDGVGWDQRQMDQSRAGVCRGAAVRLRTKTTCSKGKVEGGGDEFRLKTKTSVAIVERSGSRRKESGSQYIPCTQG